MGLFTFIKERLSYLVVGLITIAILAFIISDVVRNGTPFFRESQNQVGTISGEKVTYDEFNEKLRDKEEQFKAQYHQASLPEQTKHFVNEQAWNDLVSQRILDHQISKAGVLIEPSSTELYEMTRGSNPDPQIKQAFTDPQTGVFDRSKVEDYLKNIKQDQKGDGYKKWERFEAELLRSHSTQKYLQLIKGGVYITKLEMMQSLNIPEKRSVDYIVLDYNRLADDKVTVNDQDLKTYYDNHAYLYRMNEEQRSFEYVVFSAKPSIEDTAFAKKDIEKLAEDFKVSKDDSLFVSINSDTKVPLDFQKKAKLPHNLDSAFSNSSIGTVFGPYFENGAYKIAKLLAIKDLPDSVKSRHILLSDASQPGGQPVNYPALMKKADSLKSVIVRGGSFASLAMQFSADKGSATKGGELGYSGMGALVKPFQDAIFYGKKGEYKIVETQFGVHLIEILDQKNINKSYQIGIVDRPFHPSNKTLQDNYAKATLFFSGVSGQDFTAFARKQGLFARTATDIKANDAQINNVDNSRKVITWAFGTKIGTVSEVFDLGESAVVAKLSGIKVKGTLPFETVKIQVQSAVIKEKKGLLLSQQLTEASRASSSISALATKFNVLATSADSIGFSDVQGKNINDPTVFGAIFGAPLNAFSKPVVGSNGVYVLRVKASIPIQESGVKGFPTSFGNLLEARANASINDAMEAMKKRADVTDNRSKFFL